MAMSEYLQNLRKHVGHDLVLLPAVSGVIFNDAGELLLGRRSDTGGWSLLAGMVDPGEQPADALVREVREESGIEIAVERLVGVALHPVTYPNGDRCDYLSVWFRCRHVSGEAVVNDEESLDMRWFAPDELPEMEDFARLRIDSTLRDAPEAWFTAPGETHPLLTGRHSV
ncbi:NUDIX hydrolase [Dactylosporangium sp. NPDC051541]|uniref:NUDIX hydrolase n=1 Tax=Dactylosporangium sp. NPDC051541 TaxID=3363977 RepID=UPI0037BA4019